MKIMKYIFLAILISGCAPSKDPVNPDTKPNGWFEPVEPGRTCSQWSPVPIGSQDLCLNKPCTYYWKCTGYLDEWNQE